MDVKGGGTSANLRLDAEGFTGGNGALDFFSGFVLGLNSGELVGGDLDLGKGIRNRFYGKGNKEESLWKRE